MISAGAASLWWAAVAYVIVSLAWFGDCLQPLRLALVATDRLVGPLWLLAVFAIAASFLMLRVLAERIRPPFRLALALALSMSASIVLVGIGAEVWRIAVISDFQPDDVRRSSFFRSIREAPKDFQFFLHAAALKDCTPYGWSYRRMEFYVLPQNVAPNVLDRDWIERCDLRRSERT